jgi:hypothetical protein
VDNGHYQRVRQPANIGYQRDLSISYERLAGLAVARGEGAQGEELYTARPPPVVEQFLPENLNGWTSPKNWQ